MKKKMKGTSIWKCQPSVEFTQKKVLKNAENS